MNLSTLTKVTTAKLADGAVSLAKLDYDVIEKFDDKQNVVTGAITTCTSKDLTAGGVVVTDADGKLTVSSKVQAAELDYLGGVTANIQIQLDQIGFMPLTDVLVVAGGGAGGGAHFGGGGGGGGFLQESVQFTANKKYGVFVGAGGASSNTKTEVGASGFKGEPSAISGPGVRVVAEGGGGGGSENDFQARGKDGGSGGGASGYANFDGAGGDETFGQGKRGGRGGWYAGGGGGGAKVIGFDGGTRNSSGTVTAGNGDGGAGGDGSVFEQAKTTGVATFSGTPPQPTKLYFSGGGGGGSGQSPSSTTKVSAGGKGGGGTGGNETVIAPTPGLANTGGGGGGMSYVSTTDTTNHSTAGGSGIVCINYPKGFKATGFSGGVEVKDKDNKVAAILFKASGYFYWTAEPPTVTVASVNGTVGVPLTYQVGFTGEVDEFTTSINVGGLTFSTDTGTYIGTPTTAGPFKPTVTATIKDGSTLVGTGKGIITFTIGKGTQTITQNDDAVSMQVGDPAYPLGAATTSALALTYASNNTTVATVSTAGLVTIKAAGTAKITISQAGTANWKAATSIFHTLTVTNPNT